MKRISLICVLFFFLFNFGIKTIHSEEEEVIQVIYSDVSVDKNDIIKVIINLSDVEYYQSIQVIIDLDNKFEVVDDIPCQLVSNSYFNSNEVYVNSIEEEVIKFIGFKQNSVINNSFNNICVINLKVLENTDNVDELFKTFKISLFNEEYESIPIVIKKSEGLKYNWNIEQYSIRVFEEFPSFLDDIKITNRNNNDYSIRLIDESLDSNVIGNQIVSVYIYDFTNEQTIYLSKTVEVVDDRPPIINGDNILMINDFDLKEDLFHHFDISDNYDENLQVIYKYYDQNKNALNDFNEFYEYLKYHLIGYIEVQAIDSSHNESEIFVQEVKINDTHTPVLEYEESINILDTEIENINIYDYIKISDDYDPKPQIVITDGLNFKDNIYMTYQESIVFYGIDNIGNKTESKKLKINLIDSTSPILEKIKDLEINDIEYNDFQSIIKTSFSYSDNLSKELTYEYIYLQEDKEISLEEFNTLLYKGESLFVKITGYDLFKNRSNTISVLIKLNDTTNPIITVKNVENNKKYLAINKLDYEVSDNFLNELKVSIYLNEEVYDNTPITNPGQYVLKIVVVDGNNNIDEEVINFEIIKNNLIGCGLDSECYQDNYKNVIYMACGILGLVIIIVVIKVILNRPKKPTT